MARKQNKSGCPTRKDSSVRSINTQKTGKVQKKGIDKKSKKNIESKLKQAVNIKVKQNKSNLKQSSSVETSRRSSRVSNASASASHCITPVKNGTTIKASSRTAIKQSTTKRKSNSLEEQTKTNSMSSKSKIKIEISTSSKKKSDIKVNVRGEKRKLAQLISDSETESNIQTKKRKTNEPKNLTSRGNRNIKPTLKGSEWQKTILQKKTIAIKQEKTSSQLEQISIKKVSSNKNNKAKSPVKNKSPKQNWKNVPITSNATKGEGKVLSKLSRRKTNSQIEVSKNPLSAKKVIKTPVKKISSKKSPKIRTSSRKSNHKFEEEEEEIDSVEANTLAKSIKNKFNSCFAKKDEDNSVFQENVLVVQGILNDILSSVGKHDTISITDEAVNSISNIVEASIFQTSVLNGVDKNKVDEGFEKTNTLSQTMTQSTTKSFSNLINKEDDTYKGNSQEEKVIELTSEYEVSHDVVLNGTDGKPRIDNLDDSLEEMDLRLDISTSSSNVSDIVSTENTLIMNPDILKSTSVNGRNDEDHFEINIDSNKKLDGEVTKEPSGGEQKESLHVNGKCTNERLVSSGKLTSSWEVKDSSQTNATTGKCLQKKVEGIRSVGDTQHSSPKLEQSNILGTLTERIIEPNENVEKKIILDKEEDIICTKERSVSPPCCGVKNCSQTNDTTGKFLQKNVEGIRSEEDTQNSSSKLEPSNILGTSTERIIEPNENVEKNVILDKEETVGSEISTNLGEIKCKDSVTCLNGLENGNDSDFKLEVANDVLDKNEIKNVKGNEVLVSKSSLKLESNECLNSHQVKLNKDYEAELKVTESKTDSEENDTNFDEKPATCQNVVDGQVDPAEIADKTGH